jgi:hypothetical protein
MAKAMELLRKIGIKAGSKPEGETAFDLRLRKLGGVRKVSVSRAVLFRTQPARPGA